MSQDDLQVGTVQRGGVEFILGVATGPSDGLLSCTWQRHLSLDHHTHAPFRCFWFLIKIPYLSDDKWGMQVEMLEVKRKRYPDVQKENIHR
jgi:hypothetical protein